MDIEQREQFTTELRELCSRYKLVNVSICGTCKESRSFYGAVTLEDQSVTDVTAAIVNVGRLWQHARTIMRDLMDGFEKP